MEDRRRRELNILVFNLKEGTSTIGQENKLYDEDSVMSLAEAIKVENLDILTCYRMGKKTINKIRPLKVILKDRKQRKVLLQNAKDIRVLTDEVQKLCVISKDLTDEQRTERKAKYDANKNAESKIIDVNMDGHVVGNENVVEDEEMFNDSIADQTVVGGLVDYSQVKEKTPITPNDELGLRLKLHRSNMSSWTKVGTPPGESTGNVPIPSSGTSSEQLQF